MKRDTPASEVIEIGTRPLASEPPASNVVPISAARSLNAPETAAGHIRNAMTILTLSGDPFDNFIRYERTTIDAVLDRLRRALERMGVSQ
jgi:hypothetical protein